MGDTVKRADPQAAALWDHGKDTAENTREIERHLNRKLTVTGVPQGTRISRDTPIELDNGTSARLEELYPPDVHLGIDAEAAKCGLTVIKFRLHKQQIFQRRDRKSCTTDRR